MKEIKQEQEKLFSRERSQQAKEERDIFLGFLYYYYLINMEKELRYI